MISDDCQLPTVGSTASPHPGWFIAAIVLGMVAMQFVAGRMQPEQQRPGTERHDLVLRQADLPPEIHGWKQSSFEPAKPAGQLLEGQYWWTHSWIYSKPPLAAHVAFDQLGLHEWHELTVCYQAKGWEIRSRTIATDSLHNSSWDYVVAEMSNRAGEFALVVFSVFSGDGQPMTAPRDSTVINFTGQDKSRDTGIMSRIASRMVEQETSSDVQVGLENRGLQCQVFFVSQEPVDQEEITDAVQLHLSIRQRFRAAWLLHARSNVSK